MAPYGRRWRVRRDLPENNRSKKRNIQDFRWKIYRPTTDREPDEGISIHRSDHGGRRKSQIPGGIHRAGLSNRRRSFRPERYTAALQSRDRRPPRSKSTCGIRNPPIERTFRALRADQKVRPLLSGMVAGWRGVDTDAKAEAT